MKAYPAYKDSGIEWLGKIPEDWLFISLKYLLKPGNNGIKIGPFGSALKSNILTKEGYKVYGQENIIKDDFTIGDRFIGEGKFIELNVYKLKANDIIVTMMGTAGKSKVFPENADIGIMDSHLIRLRPQEGVGPLFISILINNSNYLKVQLKKLSKGSIMEGLNSTIIKSLKIALPPLEEQKAIVTFLDRKTAQIDGLIGKKERMIALLKEERAAVINHAVTKGIDPNAPMKDSGIQWIGEIPKHWDIKKLGWLTKEINDINHEMPPAVENGIPFLSAKDLLDNGVLNFEDNIKKISEEDFIRLSKKIRPKRDDIIYSRIGAKLGKARLVNTDIKFLVSYSCCVIRIIEKIAFSEYICFILDSDILLTEAKARTVGIGVPDLGLNEIARFPIPLPPKNEQKRILNLVKENVKNIDRTISKIQKEIELLKEYRTAMISEAVTGKIDVRNHHQEGNNDT